ncbi:MAG: Holliday junction resolvase RuvX [Patescibacteria group bacterium]
MKYLGIDYGKKKIGIAKSNDEGTIAFPDQIIAPNADNSHVQVILDLCEKENIGHVVIGYSSDLDGKKNAIEKDIEEFILHLGGNLTIHRVDERMSTSGVQAHLRHTFQKKTQDKHKAKNAKQVREHTKDDDAKVAAYILQSFLDMQERV